MFTFTTFAISVQARFRSDPTSISVPFSRRLACLTLVLTGPFSDYIFDPFFGFNWANNATNIVAPGTARISFTSRPDLGRFLAHYFSTMAPNDGLDILRLEGESSSYLAVVNAYERVHGVKIEVTLTPQSELQEKPVEKDAWDFISYLKLEWAQGRENVGEEKLASV